MKRLLPLLLFSLLLSTTYNLRSVFGQVAPPAPSEITITAVPPRLEVEALPGATLQETLKVSNGSDQELAFSIETSDFIVTNNQGTPVAVSEAVSGRWSLKSWLTTSPDKVLVAPGQTAVVDLLIAIPADALAGGHYAMVTYKPITEGQIGGGGATVVGGGSGIEQRTGTLVYLNVIGDVTEAALLKEFSVEKTFAYYGPIKLFAEIENLGDVHLRPTGSVSVTNMVNNTVAEFELEEKNIFPFASRTYDFEVPGKYRLGRYAAKLTATAGDTNVPIEGLIYFWIIPVKEIILIAIALIALITLIVLKRRRSRPPDTPPADVLPETPHLQG
ncbi:hypothetical protein A2584_00775 [Candidatus Beckwithbacteria bacterium RIFOXYD1_FULL_50_11]|nr:MAG: hypothetical protein A2584_00775 [Candidatus Beckwithbacteria bacterium RIFOXYD1_FULL_50_11]